MKPFTVLILVAILLSGCVSDDFQATPPATGYPINGDSAIELAAEFKHMPSLSGYYLPPGVYVAEEEDANGVFFRAPAGSKSLALTGSTEMPGGIYLPKETGDGRRGFVYLQMPLLGRTQYFLPNIFFRAYGTKWRINKQSNQPVETTPASAPH